MEKKHKVIVMSGSMKYFDSLMSIANGLSAQGNIVLIPFKDPRGSENIPQSTKELYDSEHRQRIEMADEMYVVNKDGYIGKSTRSEIEYAISLGKPIKYLEGKVCVDKRDTEEENSNKWRFGLFNPITSKQPLFGINDTNKVIAKDLGFKSVITICGSMKYYDIMMEEQARLSDLGHLVYLPPRGVIGDECKNLMHFRIAASDSIYVINKAGYIGENTKENIEYAKRCKIEIQYYDDITEILQGKIITLCGSRRFLEAFRSIYVSLTLSGNTVLTPSIFDFPEEEVNNFTKEEHRRLDENHKRKIDISDIVFIVNPPDGNGHIGDNTREEIDYARSKNKMIVCMSNTDQNGRSIL